MEEFDRAIFESVIKNIIIGGYDEFGDADPAIITFIFKSGVCDRESALNIVNRESIVIKEEYADNEPLCKNKGTGNRLAELPSAVEMFNFKFPYKHMVFVKRENKIDKVVKNQCEVRVAIAV